jgi:hypothetical protein
VAHFSSSAPFRPEGAHARMRKLQRMMTKRESGTEMQGFPSRQIDFAVQTWMRETVKEIENRRTKHPRTGSN